MEPINHPFAGRIVDWYHQEPNRIDFRAVIEVVAESGFHRQAQLWKLAVQPPKFAHEKRTVPAVNIRPTWHGSLIQKSKVAGDAVTLVRQHMDHFVDKRAQHCPRVFVQPS